MLSQITANGPTAIGVLGSTDGFNFAGVVGVGEHLVGLLDADKAELATALMGGGTLSSLNGIGLSGTVYGHGTINGNFTNSGAVVGTGDGITMTGVVDGTGSLSNVKITGLLRAGASPAFLAIGDGSQLDSAEIEIGGTDGGQMDKDTWKTTAGDYDRFYV